MKPCKCIVWNIEIVGKIRTTGNIGNVANIWKIQEIVKMRKERRGRREYTQE